MMFSPADAGIMITQVLLTRKLLLGGQWIETGAWHEVASPYDGAPVGRSPVAGAAEAHRAIGAAAEALSSPLPAHLRAEILDRIADLLAERVEEAARIIVAEAGKPIKAARVEAQRAVVTYRMSAAEARGLAGDVVPLDAAPAGEGKIGFTVRVPIGIIGAITPFNFPLNLVAHKIGPALAAGCPVVLKPARQTPFSALFLAELEVEAGLPPGWLNVLVGPSSEIGDVLVDDERVRMLTFTGSADVGWKLRERAARKKVSLELGNSTPAIVAADADLDAAAAKLAASAFSFAGQSCISVQRVYVEAPAFDRFLDLFLKRVRDLEVGDPADERTDVGPLINPSDRDRVLSWIDEAIAEGATVVTGGEATYGAVVAPTVLTGVSPGMRVIHSEVFGPVCSVAAYESLDGALDLANATAYGLQAGIFTRDLGTALRAALALEFGGVTVNETPTFRTDQMPYGGVKASGNTKEGPRYAVQEMTEERLIVLQR